MIGNFGQAEVFSFHATKFLNSFEGGAIATNDDALAERIRLGVQKLPTSSVTISAGAAEFDADYDFEATLRTADRRMYEAKAAGRNCVV